MAYVYAAAMFLAGIFVIYFTVRESKWFCIVGAYFLFMGIYLLVNELLPGVDLFGGIYGIGFRCLTGAVAIISIILYFRVIKRP